MSLSVISDCHELLCVYLGYKYPTAVFSELAADIVNLQQFGKEAADLVNLQRFGEVAAYIVNLQQFRG